LEDVNNEPAKPSANWFNPDASRERKDRITVKPTFQDSSQSNTAAGDSRRTDFKEFSLF